MINLPDRDITYLHGAGLAVLAARGVSAADGWPAPGRAGMSPPAVGTNPWARGPRAGVRAWPLMGICPFTLHRRDEPRGLPVPPGRMRRGEQTRRAVGATGLPGYRRAPVAPGAVGHHRRGRRGARTSEVPRRTAGGPRAGIPLLIGVLRDAGVPRVVIDRHVDDRMGEATVGAPARLGAAPARPVARPVEPGGLGGVDVDERPGPCPLTPLRDGPGSARPAGSAMAPGHRPDRRWRRAHDVAEPRRPEVGARPGLGDPLPESMGASPRLVIGPAGAIGDAATRRALLIRCPPPAADPAVRGGRSHPPAAAASLIERPPRMRSASRRLPSTGSGALA